MGELRLIHSPTKTSEIGAFEQRATRVLGDLRGALADLVAGTSVPVRKAADLEKALGLPTTLSWQVYKLATADGGLDAASLVPKPRSMEKVIRSAKRRGVGDEILGSVSRAYAGFEDLVERAAGDRTMFDSMAAGAGGGDESVDLQHRRAAYRAGCHIWGVRVQTRVNCYVIHPSSAAGLVDTVMISGNVGFRRFRRGVSRSIATTCVTDETGRRRASELGGPIGRSLDTGLGVGLLSEFSTAPFPSVRTRATPDGSLRTELVSDEIGSDSDLTYFLARRDVEVDHVRPTNNDDATMISTQWTVTTPTELLLHDVLVEESIAAQQNPASRILDGLASGGELLPQRAEVKHVGWGSGVLATPDVPRYSDVTEHVLRQVGWENSVFHVYRCRLEYPVVPSKLVVQIKLG